MTDDASPAPAREAAPPDPADRPLAPWVPPMRDVMAIVCTLIFVGAYGAKLALIWWKVDVSDGMAAGIGQFDGAALTQWVGVMAWYFATPRPPNAPKG